MAISHSMIVRMYKYHSTSNNICNMKQNLYCDNDGLSHSACATVPSLQLKSLSALTGMKQLVNPFSLSSLPFLSPEQGQN